MLTAVFRPQMCFQQHHERVLCVVFIPVNFFSRIQKYGTRRLYPWLWIFLHVCNAQILKYKPFFYTALSLILAQMLFDFVLHKIEAFWNAAFPALCRIFNDPGLRVVKLIRASWAVVSLINIAIAYLLSWLQFGLDDPGFKSRQRQTFFLFYRTSRPALGPTHSPVGTGTVLPSPFYSLVLWSQTLISPFGVSK
jgi:hypothetical protein